MAIPHKAWRPKGDGVRLHLMHLSGHALTSGVEEHRIEGVPVRVFNPAKTVADCFKFRNKIGLDVALEALRDYRRKHRSGMDELWRFAKVCRVTAVMRPYLEALTRTGRGLSTHSHLLRIGTPDVPVEPFTSSRSVRAERRHVVLCLE